MPACHRWSPHLCMILTSRFGESSQVKKGDRRIFLNRQ